MVRASKIYRVMIVEDEYYLADDLAMTLRSKGAEIVGPICRLSEALSEVANGGCDAAVLDINLQDEYAYCVADKLRVQRIPFVFTTGYSAEVIASRFSDVTRFEKPCDVDSVASYVVQLCEIEEQRLVMQHRGNGVKPSGAISLASMEQRGRSNL